MTHDPDGEEDRFKEEEREQRTRPCFVLQETLIVAAQEDIARADGGKSNTAAAGAPAFPTGPCLKQEADMGGRYFHGSGGKDRSSRRGKPMGGLGAPVTGGMWGPDGG